MRSTIRVETPGRGLHEVTGEVAEHVLASGIREGVCHLFLRHTSASLLVQENADPTARVDLERFFDRVAPDGDPSYTHTAEGPDDMSAHLRAALTRTSEVFPVVDGRLLLGRWQGIFLFEHRIVPHVRTLDVTVLGKP